MCDEGSETDGDVVHPLWEANILRLVSEENFGDNKCRMNSWAEKEDEEKVKHRDLLFESMKGILIKGAEEGYCDR